LDDGTTGYVCSPYSIIKYRNFTYRI